MTNINVNPFPTLNTERLTLRELVNSDANELFLLRSNEEVNRYLGRKPGRSLEETKSFIQTINENVNKNTSIYWAISLDKQLIGTICLFDFDLNKTTAEIGYELLPGFQGKGLMQEACSKILEFGFQNLGLNSIEAYTHPENKNSTKLLEILLFQQQGQNKNNFDNDLLKYKISNGGLPL